MMTIALLHNHFDIVKLAAIMQEMLTLGAPTIRVFDAGDGVYQAIEGCHRLRAAAALGLTPEFDELDADTLRSECEDLDYEDGLECDPSATIESMGDSCNIKLVFAD